MKKLLLILSIQVIPVISFASNIATDSSTGLAKIISIQPNYINTQIQVPQKSCTDTTTNTPITSGTTTGKVVGGVTGAGVGAILGNQVSQGGGGTAIGAVTGALLGGFAGNSLSQTDTTQKSTSTSCTTTYVTQNQSTQQGYIVSYFYNGVSSQTIMQNKPIGQYINISQIN